MKHAISNLFAVILLTAGAASAATSTPAGVTRTDLQRHDLSIAGRETIQARIDIAPGAVAPWHRHPGEEVIYVIEGTLEYQLEGRPPVTVTAGQVLFVPAGVAHMARNRTATNGAELATYIVEKGKPLLVPAEVPTSETGTQETSR
ncbi:cupin domain-containing protein [Sphingopyxis sp.]|uniref:cupin domain-containing protein n=1 Tax=Sphingopyxis sp. TaxID=1908224 RepID=UPI002B47F450|nr:cupin domain-containing protein [Sphingopyxis sp.]HJS13137.1 cupin domain-containing protein [Sphingopyxis sp.]